MPDANGDASDTPTLPTMILEQEESRLSLVRGDQNVLSGRLARAEGHRNPNGVAHRLAYVHLPVA